MPRTLQVALIDEPLSERRTVLGAGGIDRQKLAFDVEEHDALRADLEADPLPFRNLVKRSHLRERCHVGSSLPESEMPRRRALPLRRVRQKCSPHLYTLKLAKSRRGVGNLRPSQRCRDYRKPSAAKMCYQRS